VTICAGRLAIERDDEQLERSMSSSGLRWADDDDDERISFQKTFCFD
jgi:hypothetical protein